MQNHGHASVFSHVHVVGYYVGGSDVPTEKCQEVYDLVGIMTLFVAHAFLK